MESFLLGTLGLDALLVIALLVTMRRRPQPNGTPELGRAAVWAIAVQAGHATEELATGFHEAFPEFFGLKAWSPSLFVAFNATWFLLWTLAAARPGSRPAFCALMFLALGSLANLPAHAGLAVATGGWFPGLGTAPLGAWTGFRLLRALFGASQPRGSTPERGLGA